MKLAAVRWAIAGACLFVAGCSDDWGEKIEKFVDTEVHSLSKSIAENELNLRWLDYFTGLNAKTVLAIDGANKLIDSSELQKLPLQTFDEREKALVKLEELDSGTITAASTLREARLELERSQGICTASGALHRFDVVSLGQKIASQISIPREDFNIEVSCSFATDDGGSNSSQNSNSDKKDNSGPAGCWKSLVSIVTAIFGSDQQKKQKEKAEKAIGRVPETVVTAKEVEDISKGSCEKARANAELKTALESSRAALDAALKNTQATAVAYADARVALEQRQMPYLVQKVLTNAGQEMTGSELVQEYQATRYAQRLEAMRKELAQLEQSYTDSSNCAQFLSVADIYQAVLTEKSVQINAILEAASVEPVGYKSFNAAVGAAQSALAVGIPQRQASLCPKS